VDKRPKLSDKWSILIDTDYYWLGNNCNDISIVSPLERKRGTQVALSHGEDYPRLLWLILLLNIEYDDGGVLFHQTKHWPTTDK
jgi:hypothetical protein